MFPLLRYFSVASAIAITCVTAFLSFDFWRHANEDLVSLSASSNEGFAQSFANAVWSQVRDDIVLIENSTMDDRSAHPAVQRTDALIRSLVVGLPVLKIKIYGPGGQTAFSSDFSQIGVSYVRNAVFMKVMEEKAAVSKTSYREQFGAFDGLVYERHLVETYYPIIGADGTIEGVFEIYRDVTPEHMKIRDRVLIEAGKIFILLMALYIVLFVIVRKAHIALRAQYDALESSEQRFTDFAEAASDWLWEMDKDYRFTYMSGRVEEIIGISADYYIGKTRQEIAGESVSSEKWRQLDALMARREPIKNFEYAFAEPGGALRYINVSGVPVYDVRGDFNGYRGSTNDVTARYEAMLRAHEAENLLMTAINSIGDGFVVFDEEDRFVICNNKYKDFYPRAKGMFVPGVKFEDALRTSVQRGDIEDAKENPEAWITERMTRHLSGDNEIEQELSDGRWLRIIERKTPSGGIVGFRIDITQLKHAQMATEDAYRAKSEFLASMSHEIRTPMTGVIGFADMLLDDGLEPRSAEKVRKIKEATSSLLTIINDILDISKLDAGKLEIESLDFNPAQIANDVVQLFYATCPEAKRDRLTITAKLSPGFPEHVKADPTRLRQVLVNLVGNAVKFTDEGSVTLVCGIVPDANSLRFDVVDTGIGIDEATKEKLFEDFVQADASVSRKYHGTGLGLSICLRLVQLMGGEIGVESKPGEGSTFWFTLPYDESAENVVIEDSRSFGTARFAASRSLEILVAEDNEINQTIIRSILTKMGHQPTFAQHGREAVALVSDRDFDLILMDIRMPELSGDAATREIRAMSGFKGIVPIIALTADVMSDNIQSYFDAGMNDCVSKPIDHTELATAINKAVRETVNMASDVD